MYFFVFYDSRLRVFQFVSTDADIRTDRRRHPHRPTQTSASTDADIRIDRRGCYMAYFDAPKVAFCD